MVNKLIKYLVLSDIHLGHNQNITENIVNNLRYYFKINHKFFKDIKIIFLAGDIFHRLLPSNSNEFILAAEWITELLLYCKGNNIKLRILEGTPSHDWGQVKVVNATIAKLNIDVDYKYIYTLHIERLPEYDLDILYIPDEYKHKASDTMLDIHKLLKENSLEKVDITIMHGQFNYQLPMVKLESSFIEKDLLDITRHYISVGHIHTSSVYQRILAQGSFDRLSNNEEEKKGGMIITISPSMEYDNYVFLENTKAKVFKTYKYLTEDTNDIMKDLRVKLKTHSVGEHIRIIVSDNNLIIKSVKDIIKEFKHLVVKVEAEKNKSNDEIKLLEHVEIYSFTITKDNIVDLLIKELKDSLTPEELKIALNELDIVLSN